MKTAVIVIPTYNEVENIKELIADIFAVTERVENWNIEVLVNDSNSPDNTADAVKSLQKKYKKLHLISSQKEGLGKAYVQGFRYAIDTLHAYVVFEMDADHSHDPKEIPNFLKEIEQGADIVIGSRYMKGGSIPKNWGLYRKIFSIMGNWIIRTGFMKFHIMEWTNGYRAIKSWLIKDAFSHIENYGGYVFQLAELDFAVKKNARIKEIPIKFKDRIHGESKISFFGYISSIFLYIFRHSSFVKFAIVGGTGFLIDFGLFYAFTKFGGLHSIQANLISTESAVINNYLLNNFWSFSHKRVEHRASSYVRSFFKYNLVSTGSIAIQTLGLELMKHLFGEHNLYFYKIGIIILIIIPYSYFFFNRFIWKEKK
jgi:dolichol-phosphate mannosyltransferase